MGAVSSLFARYQTNNMPPKKDDATQSVASAMDVLNIEKKVFYKTDDDSAGANFLRKLRCGCFDPHYVMTTEAIKISEWHCSKGGCCTRKSDSIDTDEIFDMSMVQTCGPGYFCF